MEEKAKIVYNEYMKQYMKKYRNSEKGKKICNEAKERYYIKKYNEGIKKRGNNMELSTKAKESRKEYAKEYYKTHEKEIRAYRKVYLSENKEKLINQRKKHYKENIEEQKECSKVYYQAHKEEKGAYHKIWYAENKEKVAEYKRAYWKHKKEMEGK